MLPPYCNQKAGFLRRQHGQCRDLHAAGIQEMTQLAAQAAGTASFNETALRSTLRAIAARARATEDDISQAIAAGWAQGVQHAMSDGILTQQEENGLRDFRDHLALLDNGADADAIWDLEKAAGERLMMEARLEAVAGPGRGQPPP